VSNSKPVAVNLFSLRRQLIVDFERALERVAAMGYAGVEPMVFGPVPQEALPEDLRIPTPDARQFRQLLDGMGLATASLHAPLPEGDGADWVLDFAEALGTDQLVLSSWLALPDAAHAHTDAALIPRVAERFDAACELAAKRGLRIGFHNHHFEWEHDLAGRNAWDLFWGAVDERVVAEVDVYWAATAGRDPVAEIEALGARVRRVHLKDGPAVLGEPQVALGEGRLDIEACARAARHADWYIVELDECATDMFDALAASYRYLDERGLGLTSPPSPALP